MSIKGISSSEKVAVSKIRTERIKENTTSDRIKEKKETKRVTKSKLNEMKVSEKQIKSQDEAKSEIKKITEKIKTDRSSLKAMDRVVEIRDKALATLS